MRVHNTWILWFVLTSLQSIPNFPIEGAERELVPVQVQIIFCLKRKKEKTTPIDGSSMLSVIFSNRTFVFSWIRATIQVQRVSIIYEKLLIYQLECWRGDTDRIFSVLLIAAQNFEYIRCWNILDKSLIRPYLFFSLDFFGCWLYFTLIGPWIYHGSSWSSAYRYIALKNDRTGEGPLQTYSLGVSVVNFLFVSSRRFCWICLWM